VVDKVRYVPYSAPLATPVIQFRSNRFTFVKMAHDKP